VPTPTTQELTDSVIDDAELDLFVPMEDISHDDFSTSSDSSEGDTAKAEPALSFDSSSGEGSNSAILSRCELS